MDDLQPLLDLLPAAIPPRYVALALAAVFLWEHLLASTEWVRANSTIRLVGDMAVAVVRRLARRPPPPALLALVALALGACDVFADVESVVGGVIFAFCIGTGSLLIGSALVGRSARRRRLLDDAADAREVEMTDIDGNRLAVRRGPDLDGRPVMLIRPILPQLSDDEAKAMSDAIAAKRKRGAVPMSLVLALLSAWLIPACALSPKGRAYVAAHITVATIDAGCVEADRRFSRDRDSIRDAAIAACPGQGAAPRACMAAKIAPWEGVRDACSAYALARGAASGLDDLSGAAAKAAAALAAVNVEVRR